MNHYSTAVSTALLQSLIEGPLLLTSLPEAHTFPHNTLTLPDVQTSLNFEQKLGHLYEDALETLLDPSSQYDLIDKSLQIRENSGRTLGELDFLVKDTLSASFIHLELAVKFYLAIESDDHFLLPGPDARDNYFRKLEKMRSHQLSLVRKYPHLLPEKFQHEEITVQQLVYGCIFDHIHANLPVETEFLHPSGRRGKWLRAQECSQYFRSDTTFEIIPKTLWPVPLHLMEHIELELWQPTDDIPRCLMIRTDTSNSPYFITPNSYPENGC